MTKLIVLDDEFFKRPIVDQVMYLRKGWSASNEALDQMQNERNDLLSKINEMQAIMDAAEMALNIQKSINTQVIQESNERMQRDAEEIQNLKAEVRAT